MISPIGIRSRINQAGREVEAIDTDATNLVFPLGSTRFDGTTPPWSDLQQIKQEANEMAMLVPFRNLFVQPISKPISHEFPAVFDENDLAPDDECEVHANAWTHTAATTTTATTTTTTIERKRSDDSFSQPRSTASLQFTSFSSSSERLFDANFPAATTLRDEPWAVDESQEYTIEHFHRIMNRDRAAAMGQFALLSSDEESAENGSSLPRFSSQAFPGRWPGPLLGSNDLLPDAPSGILLVFDRVLDCIDPHGASSKPRDLGSLDEDDLSSLWSLAMSRSSLVRELEAGSTYSGTTDEDCSLEVHPKGNGSRYRFATKRRPIPKPVPLEELQDTFDCMFPCWEDPVVERSRPTKSLRDLAAADVEKKRKWKSKNLPRPGAAAAVAPGVVTTYHYTDVELVKAASWRSEGSEQGQSDDDAPRFRDFGAESPDARSCESSRLLRLHDPVPIDEAVVVRVANGDESSSSSLSELFDGLMVWTPSDLKQEEEDNNDEEELDELGRILDRTSVTEETSTLSYSSCTYS